MGANKRSALLRRSLLRAGGVVRLQPALHDLFFKPRQRELHVLAGGGLKIERTLLVQAPQANPVL